MMKVKYLFLGLALLPGGVALADVPFHHYCYGSVRADANSWYQISVLPGGTQKLQLLTAKPASCDTTQLVRTWAGGVGDADVSQLPPPDPAPIDGTGSSYYSISPDVQYGTAGVLGQLLGTFFEGPPFSPPQTETMETQLQGLQASLNKSIAAMKADTLYVQNQIPGHTQQMTIDAAKVKDFAAADVQTTTGTLTVTQTALNERPPVTVQYPTTPAGQVLQGLRTDENRVAIAKQIPPDALLPSNGSVFSILDPVRSSSYGVDDAAAKDLIHEERKLEATTPQAGQEDQLVRAHALLADAMAFQPSPGGPAEQIVEALIEEARQRRFAALGLLAQPQTALWDGYSVYVSAVPAVAPDGPVAMSDLETQYVEDHAAAEQVLNLVLTTITIEHKLFYNRLAAMADLSLQYWHNGDIWSGYLTTSFSNEGGRYFATFPAQPIFTDAEKAEMSKVFQATFGDLGIDAENESLVRFADLERTKGAGMIVGAARSFADFDKALYNAVKEPSEENTQKAREEFLKMGMGITVDGTLQLLGKYIPESLPVDILITLGKPTIINGAVQWTLGTPEELDVTLQPPSPTPVPPFAPVKLPFPVVILP